MNKAIMVYKDKAGNKLYKRYIKSRDITQYSAKNREGKLVNKTGVVYLTRKAGLGIKKVRKQQSIGKIYEFTPQREVKEIKFKPF